MLSRFTINDKSPVAVLKSIIAFHSKHGAAFILSYFAGNCKLPAEDTFTQ